MPKMIVLVKINHPRYTYHPPQGLLYVANALRKVGFEVKIFHIMPEEVSECAKKIADLKPLFVGFSVFTGEAMRSYAWLSRKIKSLCPTTIVWGNAHPTLLPEQCLSEHYIDIVVMGEGEITAVELAKSLSSKIPQLESIKGIGFKDSRSGKTVINPERPFIENLDDYKPEWELIDVEKYLIPYYEAKRALPISTSRGCLFDCGFCYNKKFNRRKWRAHSVEYVTSLADELKKKYSIDGIIVTDDNFFTDKKRAFQIVKKIDFPYYCETRSSYFDEEFAKNLNETKCRSVLLGMESGSDMVLELIRKESTVLDNISAVQAVSKYHNIMISGSFIIAFPTETEKQCKETMELIAKLLEIKKEMNFTLGYYLPYPGSSLYELAIKEGFRPPSRTEDWEDVDRWASNMRISWLDWMTSEKAVLLRAAVLLLRDCYQPSLKLSRFKSYIKDKTLSLDVENFRMKALLGLHTVFFRGKKEKNFYPIISFLYKIYSRIVRLKKRILWGLRVLV